jgi:pimeloyl-ACP methyl ester carboxylesterase
VTPEPGGAARWLDVQGLRVRVYQAGAAGPPVVLLHGGGADAAGFSFRDTIPALAPSYRVFAPEWPGFGESAPLPRGWRVADLAPFLAAALDRLEVDRASLVGLSLGGAVALDVALRWPARVDRLVLVDSYGLGGSLVESYGRLGGLAAEAWIRAPAVNAWSWRVIRRLVRSPRLARWLLQATVPHRRLTRQDPLLGAFVALFRRPDAGAAWQQLQEGELLPGGRLRTDFADRLGGVTAPTLLVLGADDRAVPRSWVERAQRRIAGAQLVVVPDAGHVTPLDRPAAFNEHLRRFLSERRAAPPG